MDKQVAAESLLNQHIEKIYLRNTDVDESLISLISENYAKRNCVFPFKMEEKILHVAFGDIYNTSIKNELKLLTNKNIKIYKDDVSNINYCIEKFYGNRTMDTINIEEQGIYTKLTDMIISSAIVDKASDIHIEPFEDIGRIRFRVNGHLKEYKNIPMNILERVIRRIKILSSINIASKLIPCDGKFSVNKFGSNYDLRVSTIPTIYGEKVVIRILNSTAINYSLEEITDNEIIRNCFKKILRCNNGIILLCGPTGSGKSTSLYAFVNELNNLDKNIITIEDPVEFRINGVNQVNVNNKSGLTFEAGLKSILRQDPDILVIGEIRDEETADIAIRAAITGHLVLSTIHTTNAVSTINRLQNMKIKNYLISDAIVAIISQRLVRINCPHCKVEHKEKDIDEEVFENRENIIFLKGQGCNECNYTGYMGRKSIYEILPMNDEIKKGINSSLSASELNKLAVKQQMISLNTRCEEMLFNGETSYEEYMNIIYSVR
jgi:type IV pilus assembly protein PilB